MPRTAKAQAEREPLTPMQEVTAEYERAEAALFRAEALLADARSRKADTEAGIAAAQEATRKASLALADDPDADALLDDSVVELARLEHRLKALNAQTIPAVEATVAARQAEMDTARTAYRREALRDAVRTQIAPADRRFIAAIEVAAEAYRASVSARVELQERGLCAREAFFSGGDLSANRLALAVPTALAQLTSTSVVMSPYAGIPPQVTHPKTGGDLLGFLASRFGIDPDNIPHEPAPAEPGDLS